MRQPAASIPSCLLPTLVVLLALSGAASTDAARAESPATAGEPAAYAPPAPRVWLGPDKNPLPFQTDEEATAFLATAEVLDKQPIPIGVTRSRRLLLEKDGVQVRAVFKTIHEIRDRVRLEDGTFVMFFRDTYLNEIAAYELSRMLGMETVPPTVPREIRGAKGSLQLWIESATMELHRRARGLTAPDEERWRRKIDDMAVFDNLINNIDRNLGDMLYDQEWNLWLIDHSRAFGRERALPRPERVTRCSTALYEALQALDQKEVTQRLSPYLGRFEIRALMQRRDALLRLLDEKIARLGTDPVLFSYDEPAAASAEPGDETDPDPVW